MIYADVKNGKVVNLIEMEPAQEPEFPTCVSCRELPVWIGDDYDGENFLRNGKIVKTLEEQKKEEETAEEE